MAETKRYWLGPRGGLVVRERLKEGKTKRDYLSKKDWGRVKRKVDKKKTVAELVIPDGIDLPAGWTPATYRAAVTRIAETAVKDGRERLVYMTPEGPVDILGDDNSVIGSVRASFEVHGHTMDSGLSFNDLRYAVSRKPFVCVEAITPYEMGGKRAVAVSRFEPRDCPPEVVETIIDTLFFAYSDPEMAGSGPKRLVHETYIWSFFVLDRIPGVKIWGAGPLIKATIARLIEQGIRAGFSAKDVIEAMNSHLDLLDRLTEDFWPSEAETNFPRIRVKIDESKGAGSFRDALVFMTDNRDYVEKLRRLTGASVEYQEKISRTY